MKLLTQSFDMKPKLYKYNQVVNKYAKYNKFFVEKDRS